MTEITYIIAIYNIEKDLLTRCLSSVVGNMGCNDEAWIINDGSTYDFTEEICKRYVGARVQYYYQENGGISSARNAGIRLARGKYIAFIDGDDYLSNGSVEITDKIGNADIVLMNYKKYTQEGIYLCKPKFFPAYEKNPYACIMKSIMAENDFKNYYMGVVWNKLFSREFLLRNGLKFKENVKKGEDGLFIINCMLFKPSVEYADYDNYVYYVNPNSVCHKFNLDLNGYYIDYLKELGALVQSSDVTDIIDQNLLEDYYKIHIFNSLRGLLKINSLNTNLKLSYRERKRLAKKIYNAFDDNFKLKKIKIGYRVSKKTAIKIKLMKRKNYFFIWLYNRTVGNK